MSQTPNNNYQYDTALTAYRNTQDDISNFNENTSEYRNLWLETPLKLMLKLVKQHLPNIEKAQVNIEEKKKLWKLVKEKLDAAGYHFSAIQIERKYQYIERYYKNVKAADNVLASASPTAPEEPSPPLPPLATGSPPEPEEENNKQISKPRCSKNKDPKYGEIFDLLESWGLAELKSKFKANYIVFQALEYLTEADIIELIPKIGQRAIFRAKLNQWRQEKSATSSPPTSSTSTSSPSTSINVPEPKKIKLEPGLEVKSPPQLQMQQPIEQQISHQLQPQQPIAQPNANGAHKVFGNLTTTTKAKPKRGLMKKPNNSNNTPNMQSRVQQFYIGSSPPQTSPVPPPPPTPTGTATGTGICRLPSPPSVNTFNGPRLTLVNPVTSPSLYYNIPSHIECRRFPPGATPQSSVPATQFPTPVTNPVRVINSDNLSAANALQVRKTPANANSPTFVADLTPFATSIIRVETNCETQYPSIGTPSPQNPVTKMKRTTIIQKLKNDNKVLPIQAPTQVPKPIIMPKPMQILHKPLRCPPVITRSPLVGQLFKSPLVSRSPEVPRPKPFLIPKKEPLEEEEEQKNDDQETMDWNEFCEARKKSEKLPVVEIQQEPQAEPEPEPKHEPEPEPNHHESDIEPELEFDPESNPEVEEFTLADAVTELPDLIKAELLDSDSHSHSDQDQDQTGDNEKNKEKDSLLKEMPDPKDTTKDSHDSQDTQDTKEPKGDFKRLDIRSILMGSKSGRQVIKRYVAEEILDEPKRKLLIDTIAQHCYDNEIHITPTYCKDISEEIIEIFPNERMEEYFVRKGKKLRSPMYSKFHHIRRESFRKKAEATKEANSANKTNKGNKTNKTKENKKKSSVSVEEMDYDDDDNLIIS